MLDRETGATVDIETDDTGFVRDNPNLLVSDYYRTGRSTC